MELDSQTIKLWFQRHAGIRSEAITDDMDLFAEGILDSMSLLELVSYLEKNFNFEVSWTSVTMDDFRTVNAILKLAT